MSAKRAARKAVRSSAAGEPETITFSTRLTPDQRDRVVKAAELRGWTTSNLIRIAALEKSAHILNTTTRNSIDFPNLASKIARQLLKAGAELRTDSGPLDDEVENEIAGWGVYTVVDQLRATDVQAMRRAAQYGGAEFLNMIIDFCEGLVARDQGALPDPVEPVPLGARGDESEAEK